MRYTCLVDSDHTELYMKKKKKFCKPSARLFSSAYSIIKAWIIHIFGNIKRKKFGQKSSVLACTEQWMLLRFECYCWFNPHSAMVTIKGFYLWPTIDSYSYLIIINNYHFRLCHFQFSVLRLKNSASSQGEKKLFWKKFCISAKQNSVGSERL